MFKKFKLKMCSIPNFLMFEKQAALRQDGFNIARTNCYNHLCEAKFWLGFELARIREENLPKQENNSKE